MHFLHVLIYVLWTVTWGNNVAALEYLAAAAVSAWFLRDHIGRHLAAWFHKHHTAHLEGIKHTRYESAKWKPISVNYSKGGCKPRYLILHIMEGTLAGTDSWFRNPAAEVSAHFGVGKDGTLYQWVDTADTAWAEAAGNPVAVSVECEGLSGDSLTDAQVKALGGLMAWCHAEYGIPLRSTNDPSAAGSGLGWHGMGGAAWGNHPDCPGTPVREQRGAIIQEARRHLGPVLTHRKTGRQGNSLIEWAHEFAGTAASTLLRWTLAHSPDRKFADNLAHYINQGDLHAPLPEGIEFYFYLPED